MDRLYLKACNECGHSVNMHRYPPIESRCPRCGANARFDNAREGEPNDLIRPDFYGETVFADVIADNVDRTAATYVLWMNDEMALDVAADEVAYQVETLSSYDERYLQGITEHTIRSRMTHLDPP